MPDQPAAPTVLLTGLSVSEERLLVVPRDWCISEVSAHGTLEHASTFGDVRKDRGAWRQVEDGMDDYLRRLYENGEVDEDVPESTARRRHASAGASFDADTFFADEDQRWRADAYLSTEQFMESHEPEVFEVFAEQDTGWGISYTPSRLLPPDCRGLIEPLLVRLGYRILHLNGLHDLYLSSPAGRRAVLARLRSARPLHGRRRQ